MKYGLIGEKLGHSFSKIIHSELTDYDYELREGAKDELDSFMRLTGLMPVSFTYSPIKGGSGNIEYLAKLVKCSDEAPRQDFVGIVEEAFRQL